jgi:hypothetical protein
MAIKKRKEKHCVTFFIERGQLFADGFEWEND